MNTQSVWADSAAIQASRSRGVEIGGSTDVCGSMGVKNSQQRSSAVYSYKRDQPVREGNKWKVLWWPLLEPSRHWAENLDY